MKKRLLSFMLLCAIVLSQAACGGASDTQTDTTKANDAAETTATSAETELSDDLPDITFDGRTFTTLTFDQILPDYEADEVNGDVINDAVWKRNQNVMERFDVKLETISNAYYNDTTNFINTTVLAGDDTFQLVAHHIVALGSIVPNDLFMNWNDIPYINFEKPWWSPSTVEDLTYDGVTIIAVGDYALSSLAATYCYFYDKQAALDYNFEDLYKVVNDGNWTIDYVRNLVKDIYVDLNGDGEQDGEDYYGFTSTVKSALNAYLWSSGGKIFTNNNDGTMSMTYNSSRTVDIIDKLYQFCYESEGVCLSRPQYVTADADLHKITQYSFRDNLTAIIPGTLDMTVNYFRERKNEYGILPYPKLDEEQKEYKTMVDGYHAGLAIPKSITDPEFVGIITEALNAESNKIVFPAYYEVALKVKYAHDNESVQMLDMIVANRVFDFGYVYDSWKGVSFIIETMIGNNKTADFASYYASKGPAAEEYYETVIEYFDSVANG